MRAEVIHEFGSPVVFKRAEIPKPQIQPNHVIIQVKATNVKHWKASDEVYACAGGVKGTGGALAEYMLADSECISLKSLSPCLLRSQIHIFGAGAVYH